MTKLLTQYCFKSFLWRQKKCFLQMYRNNKKYEDITRISKVSLWPTHASRKIFGTSVKYLKCPELIKLLKAISSYYSVTCIAVITKSTEPTTSIDVQSHSDFSSVRNYLHRGPVSRRFLFCEKLPPWTLNSHRGKHFCKIVASMLSILYIVFILFTTSWDNVLILVFSFRLIGLVYQNYGYASLKKFNGQVQR